MKSIVLIHVLHFYKKIFLALLLFFSIANQACAQYFIWDVKHLSEFPSSEITLTGNNTKIGQIKKLTAQNILDIQSKLSSINGVNVPLYIRSDNSVNAFAFEYPGQEPFIALTLGMVNKFGDDTDLIAAVLAHEMAHIHKHHVLNKINRQQTIGFVGSIIGAIIDAKTGSNTGAAKVDKLAWDILASVASMKFTRDEEAEADTFGFQWAADAGYDLEGAVRLFTFLQGASGDGIAFLQDHPVNSERIAKAKSFTGSNTASSQSSKSITPNNVAANENLPRTINNAPATSYITTMPVPTAQQKFNGGEGIKAGSYSCKSESSLNMETPIKNNPRITDINIPNSVAIKINESGLTRINVEYFPSSRIDLDQKFTTPDGLYLYRVMNGDKPFVRYKFKNVMLTLATMSNAPSPFKLTLQFVDTNPNDRSNIWTGVCN